MDDTPNTSNTFHPSTMVSRQTMNDPSILFKLMYKLSDGELTKRLQLNAESVGILKMLSDVCPNMLYKLNNEIEGIVTKDTMGVCDVPRILNAVKILLNLNRKHFNALNIRRRKVVVFIRDLICVILDDHKKGNSHTIETLDACTILLESALNINENNCCVWLYPWPSCYYTYAFLCCPCRRLFCH